ncbi:ABC transporter substrate-binding protein [Sorangium sp. So ce887]|uniref:ABC transporter substrate-binding protein n=1 Tax=Sorangium sp. So ce887 TaxID=3133324 RepID=UPI003F646E34
MHSRDSRRLVLQRLASLIAVPLFAPACSRSPEGDGRSSAPSPQGSAPAAPAQGAPAAAQGAPAAPAQGAPAAKVKLALNWVPEPEFGGFYAAREAGAFAKEGLEVEILGGGAGVPVVQMVAGGQVDFGLSGADEVLTARARGADVLPLFAVFQTSPQAIMTHESRGAKGIADILASGGTLAIEPGLPYAAYLKKKYGFSKVKVVPYDGGVARFVADKDFSQQCFITAEPIAAKRKGSDPAAFLVASEGFNPYVVVVITRAALWKENPERVRAFIRATREGWRAYLHDPKRANEVMAPLNTAMDAETFVAAAEAQRPLIETPETREKGLGVMTRERWETLAKQLVDLGVLEKVPPIDDLLVAAR